MRRGRWTGATQLMAGWVGMGRSVSVPLESQGHWQRRGRAGGALAGPVRWDSVGWVQTQYAHAHNGECARSYRARAWLDASTIVCERNMNAASEAA